MKQGAATSHDAVKGLRFARAKFRPTAMPATLVIRSSLHDRLTAGAGQRLTVVAGSAGAGKRVLRDVSADVTASIANDAEQLLAAAPEAHAAQPVASRSHRLLAEPLTTAELRVLKLLPTSSYSQIAATLYVSRNTVKTHLRSVYQKLEVASRSQALERAPTCACSEAVRRRGPDGGARSGQRCHAGRKAPVTIRGSPQAG